MRKLILDALAVNMILAVAALALSAPSKAQYVVTEIIDAEGGGGVNALDEAGPVAVDSSGNVYVAGFYSYNVFRITPGGTITEIIDATGDGNGNALSAPYAVAVDSGDNVYVTGFYSDNAFKIERPVNCSTTSFPCVIREIIDATGDGAGNPLSRAWGVAVDFSDNVYVTGSSSDNVFKIANPGTCYTGGIPCTITEIIDVAGDGGNTLDMPTGVAADHSDNVYVTGLWGNNAFKIATPGTCSTTGTPCTITEIIDVAGDGAGNPLTAPPGVAVDSSGNVYVTGSGSDNAFKIEAPGTCSTGGGTTCTITEIIDATGDAGGNTLDNAQGVAVDSSGHVYVTGRVTDNAFKIATPGPCSTTGSPCTITEIIDATGDGGGNPLEGAAGVAVDASGNVYVTGSLTNNTFEIQPASQVPVLSTRGLAALAASLLGIVAWVARRGARSPGAVARSQRLESSQPSEKCGD